MMVFGRKAGQSILIGDRVEVIIREVKGGYVRLAVRAPREVRVMRSELLESPPDPDPSDGSD